MHQYYIVIFHMLIFELTRKASLCVIHIHEIELVAVKSASHRNAKRHAKNLKNVENKSAYCIHKIQNMFNHEVAAHLVISL